MTKPRAPMDKFRRATARGLRNNATGAEARLWKSLRQLPTLGTHFRRQVPIGPYVADFACMAARLVIELDGSQHGESANAVRDQERTRWLQTEGYRVIRFWNNEIVENMDGVLESISAAVCGSTGEEPSLLKHERVRRSAPPASHPTPARFARRPSPSRGG